MATITMRELAARHDLSDWRVLLQRIEATYRCTDFAGAAALVARVVEASVLADHPPDLDVRREGVVHVVLSTDDGGGLTEADADLAATISRIAGEAGAVPEPTAAVTVEIGVEALDIPAVRPFWVAVLGFEVGTDPAGNPAVVDPSRIGPNVWFQQMSEPRPQRNRLHLDVTVPAEVASARIDAALAAGGRVVYDAEAPSFTVLADPEGNEVCICTFQGRD